MADQDDDLDYFMREMRGVVPIKKENKAELKTTAKEEEAIFKQLKEFLCKNLGIPKMSIHKHSRIVEDFGLD